MTRQDGTVSTNQFRGGGIDETQADISARRVEGTAVYNARGDHLGTIHDVMIDKRRGAVSYAVMSFGGFLGIGEKYHPLPWNLLTYDEQRGGYVVDLTEEQLRGAPNFTNSELADFAVQGHGMRVKDYYGARAVSDWVAEGGSEPPLPNAR